jgi:hypothetical protein
MAQAALQIAKKRVQIATTADQSAPARVVRRPIGPECRSSLSGDPGATEFLVETPLNGQQFE